MLAVAAPLPDPAARTIALKPGADLDGFRAALRRLVAQDVAAESVAWTTTETPGLFGTAAETPGDGSSADLPPLRLPRPVAELIPLVVAHRDPERYALLHALVRRVLGGERALMEVGSDPLVHRLHLMRKAVARDLH